MRALQRRTMSLSDECKRLLAESGAAKALLQLLVSKKNAIRWTARQVTLPLPRCSSRSQHTYSDSSAVGSTRVYQACAEHPEHPSHF